MRLFVSYSNDDRLTIEKLVTDLQELGHTAWYDQQLTGGHVWWDEVLEHIVKCDVFLVSLSPLWQRVHSCQLEFSYALALNKRILPLLIASDVEHSMLPPEIQSLSIIDYTAQERQAKIEVLRRALDQLPPPLPLPNPLPEAPEAPLSQLGRLQQQIRAPRLTFEAQKSLVNHIKWYLYATDLREIHHAQRLLKELKAREDIASIVKSHIHDILHESNEIATGKVNVTGLNESDEPTNEFPEIDPAVPHRRIDVALRDRVTLGEMTELWVQLCLPNSTGFRDQIGHPLPFVSQQKPLNFRRPLPKPAEVRIEVRAIGFEIEDNVHEILVPPDQDTGLLVFMIKPILTSDRNIVHVTIKRMIGNEKVVTLVSVALNTIIERPDKQYKVTDAVWQVRSVRFAESVLFDDEVYQWGLQQARLQTPPAPWSMSARGRAATPSYRKVTREGSRPMPPISPPPPSAPEKTFRRPPKKSRSSMFPITWVLLALLSIFLLMGGVLVVNGLSDEDGASPNTQSVVQNQPTESTMTIIPNSTDIEITPTVVPPTPTETPQPQIRLRYTRDRLTLQNIAAAALNINALIFEADGTRFTADGWQPFMESYSLTSFPMAGCVHLIEQGADVPTRNTISGCLRVNTFASRAENTNELFWRGNDAVQTFTVRWYEREIATCDAYTGVGTAEKVCEFALP